MPEQVTVSEVRRVVIEYEIRVPSGGAMRATPAPGKPEVDLDDIVDKVRRELIRVGNRNPDIFGGRA